MVDRISNEALTKAVERGLKGWGITLNEARELGYEGILPEAGLTDNELEAILARMRPETFAEVGAQMGITMERARQLVAAANGKIKGLKDGRGMEGYATLPSE